MLVSPYLELFLSVLQGLIRKLASIITCSGGGTTSDDEESEEEEDPSRKDEDPRDEQHRLVIARVSNTLGNCWGFLLSVDQRFVDSLIKFNKINLVRSSISHV